MKRPTGKPAKRPTSLLTALVARLAKARAENAKLRDEISSLRHQLMYDNLTGIFNRAGLRHEWERVYSDAYALVVVDGDGFKRINDTYGHEVGDIALTRIVSGDRSPGRETTRNGLGSLLIASRSGGDEFVCVVGRDEASTPEELAAVLTEISTSISVPSEIHGESLSVRVSIGASIIDGVADTRAVRGMATDHADEMLYVAKRNGAGLRDRGQMNINGRSQPVVTVHGTDVHGTIAIGRYVCDCGSGAHEDRRA